uniref:DNA 3'-5' helicase n=1 Tax=Tetradesmus obliquus TaxID=3088 RepID=A0A383W498_TETOB|eukprot:jgi/Sobl393_1/10598/SZX72301.1
MTFQLPALAKGNCFTVVVGPLMALAKDQVDACLDLGIDARVWNSDTSEDVRKGILSELVSDEPELRLLYTTPESLRNPSLRGYLKEAYEAGTLLSFAIDEAHCVSEWGHDFQPAYLELSTLKTDFPKTPIAALTASCTSAVEASIVRQLRMQEPLLIKGGFNRPNIQYKVEYKELIGGGSEDDVVEHLVQFIQARQGQCGIIYARLRATCDWLCSALSASDIDVGVYHAGKDGQKRRQVQRDWCEGGLDIVVATIAFGMGIDRADVRWVVHWDVATSLEGYYQESGRAGRDGQPCESVVYVIADDLDTITRLEKANRAGAASEVTSFACQPGCKRKKILSYFGQKRGPCNIDEGEQQCGYCRDPRASSRLQLQWEEQVQRKSVQLALKKQREQMAAAADDDEDSNQLQHAQDGLGSSEDTSAAAGQGGSASTGRPRIGQWGSAKAFTEPAGAAAAIAQLQPGAKPCFNRQQGSSCSSREVLQQCGNTQPDLAQAQAAAAGGEAAAGSSSTAAGVKPPAAPVAVPQLRKRLAKPALGAFKAPRMTAPAGITSKGSADSSSSKCVAVDGHVEQQPEQQQVAAVELARQGASSPDSDSIEQQQQQQDDAAVAAACGAPSLMCSKQQQQPGAPGTGVATFSKAPYIAARTGLHGSRGRASGRQAFVPPLKRI